MSNYSTFLDYLEGCKTFVVPSQSSNQNTSTGLKQQVQATPITVDSELLEYAVLANGDIITDGDNLNNIFCGNVGSATTLPNMANYKFFGLTRLGNQPMVTSTAQATPTVAVAKDLAAATLQLVQTPPPGVTVVPIDETYFLIPRTMTEPYYYFANNGSTPVTMMQVSAPVTILKNCVIVCNVDLNITATMTNFNSSSALMYSAANSAANTKGIITCSSLSAKSVMVADYSINFTTSKVLSKPIIALNGTITLLNNTVNACVCYLKGTRLLTKTGYKAIEDIKLGDELSVKGNIEKNHYIVADDKTSKVMWVSHFKTSPNEETFPVCFKKGSLGPNLPVNDLYVSQGHHIVYKGHMIPAKRFVNNSTIFIDREKTDLVYYHIEVEKHSVLLAEGVPAESYLETGKRQLFASKEKLIKKREMKKISFLK